MISSNDIAIFMKTWEHDKQWLDYSWRSIEEFVPSEVERVIIGDEDCTHDCITQRIPRLAHGFLYSALIKLQAFCFTDRPYIIILDSDTVFTDDIDPVDTFFDDGYPIKQWRNYTEWTNHPALSEFEKHVALPAYRDSVKRHLGIEARHVYMCQNPYIVRRDTLIGICQKLGSRLQELTDYAREHAFHPEAHGIYVQSEQYISAVDCIGAYAFHYQSDDYAWREKFRFPSTKTFWSWGGVTPDAKETLDAILSRERVKGLMKHTGKITNTLKWLAENTEIESIIDIGASNGIWTREATQFFPTARVALLEPHPYHHEKLAEFCNKSPHQHVMVQKAASNGVGHAELFDDAPWSSCIVDAKNDQTFRVPRTTVSRVVSDLQLERPILVKIDTHGHEREIVEGCPLDDVAAFIIEAYLMDNTNSVRFWELCAFMAESGFRPIDIVDPYYCGVLWEVDIVFLHAEHQVFREWGPQLQLTRSLTED